MKIIGRIEKGGGQEIRVILNEWRNQTYIDFRLWYEKDGKYHPTTKGIRLNCEVLPDLRSAIDAAIQVIENGEDVGDSQSVGT